LIEELTMTEQTGELTGKQRRHLRALGYELKPTVSVGKSGVTPAVVQSVHQAYTNAELIKARLERSWEIDRKEGARLLAAATDSHLVQVLGRTVLLYRADPDEPEIKLPK
jgi:RNA-binding protein